MFSSSKTRQPFPGVCTWSCVADVFAYVQQIKKEIIVNSNNTPGYNVSTIIHSSIDTLLHQYKAIYELDKGHTNYCTYE